MSECVCVCELVACLPQLPHPLLLLAHPTPSSGACCLHLCGNPTMSTMQHKSDNAVVVLSDSGGKSCAAGSPPFAAPASAPPALSCCVVPHKNSSFLAFSLCYATSHSSTSTPRSRLVPLFTCFWLLFYVRNLHWPLCRRLLHFCFFCTAKRWKTQRRKTKRKQERNRRRGEWGVAYKNNDIKMRIILKPDCPIC